MTSFFCLLLTAWQRATCQVFTTDYSHLNIAMLTQESQDKLAKFKVFLRSKDGNQETDDESIKGDLETKLEFLLDVDDIADQRELIKKYFISTSGLSLLIEALGDEVAIALKNPRRHFDKQRIREKLQQRQEELNKAGSSYNFFNG